VRVLTETFDEHGVINGTTTTETKTALQEITNEAVMLAVDVLVKIAGKRLDAEPQVVKQGFHAEVPGQKVQIKSLADDSVTIESRKIPCHVEQVESVGDDTRTVAKTFWSATVAPYILKRETTTTDLNGEVQSHSTVEVVALDMPRRVFGEVLSTAYVKTVVTHATGATTTMSITAIDVPGGVLCHTAKEVDEKGRLVRRSFLDLIDYGLEPPNARWGLMQRLRGRWWNRSSRSAPQ
jgi:hypothetical protein